MFLLLFRLFKFIQNKNNTLMSKKINVFKFNYYFNQIENARENVNDFISFVYNVYLN